MSKTDTGLVALNLATLVFAVIGLTAQHLDPMSAAAALAIVTTVLNGGVLLRRSRAPERPAHAAPVDELDAHHVLDLDARLEAVERAQADAADAARWRALAESGRVAGPAADPAGTDDGPHRGHTRNGRV